MPILESQGQGAESEPLTKLPFPPVTKQQIIDCSYDSWYARYRTSTLRSRIIPLTPAFLEYLREDGLWLPDDEPYEETPWSEQNSNKPEDPEWESETKPNDASRFQEVHEKINDTIKELGGSVVPKLNWSTPKDALHMALSKNSMGCESANDVYLILKSSIFVTHDLEHAFDDCVDDPLHPLTIDDIKYVLVLRPFFKINTAFEFRCFVKNRTIVGISQRDIRHFDYSSDLLDELQGHIQDFFDEKLKAAFPHPNFVFDVYLPEPHDRVRLIDINPWAPRTDPLLFSWLELLTLKLPAPLLGIPDSSNHPALLATSSDEDTEEDTVEELSFRAEFRTVKKDDPEAYNFGSAPYSAHKLPKDVVDAGLAGGGAMKEFMGQWEKLMNGEELDDEDDDDDDNQN